MQDLIHVETGEGPELVKVTAVPRRRIYLAGPMRGIPEFNYPAFNEAAADLRSRGYEVVNPAELDVRDGLPKGVSPEDVPTEWWMRRDLPHVISSDEIRVLSGWQRSHGARVEVLVGSLCGIPSYTLNGAPARHPSSARLHRHLLSLGALHDKKQADYGKDDDPFSNVRSSEEFGVPGWLGAIIRGTDKVRRLQAYARNGTLENEGVEDAFKDLAVYALIGLVLFEEAQGGASK